MDQAATSTVLTEACRGIARRTPALAAGLDDTVLEATPAQGLARLLGRVLQPTWLPVIQTVVMAERSFKSLPEMVPLMYGGDCQPKTGPGAIIGADATVLGNISVGQGAIVASGSVVLHLVAPFTVVAGDPAVVRPGYRHPFGH